jgi:cell division initiation protein
MDLTARDIHEKQFHDAWRGYNQEEVDDFLDRIADVMERNQSENAQLRARLHDLEQAVATSREAEEMLKKTLVTAQQAAEEAIAKAKAKADRMVAEAEERSRRLTSEADERLATAEAEARRKSLEAETEIRRKSEAAEREHSARKHELEATIHALEGFETQLKQGLEAFLDDQKNQLEKLKERPPPPSKADARPPSRRETTPRPGDGWRRDLEGPRPHPTADATEAMPAADAARLRGDRGDETSDAATEAQRRGMRRLRREDRAGGP